VVHSTQTNRHRLLACDLRLQGAYQTVPVRGGTELCACQRLHAWLVRTSWISQDSALADASRDSEAALDLRADATECRANALNHRYLFALKLRERVNWKDDAVRVRGVANASENNVITLWVGDLDWIALGVTHGASDTGVQDLEELVDLIHAELEDEALSAQE
jgi:hypothetical protein